MVPLAGVNLGLVGWAFAARTLYIRKRREAARLREQMFEQEHRALLELEAKNSELAEAKNRRRRSQSGQEHVPGEHEP